MRLYCLSSLSDMFSHRTRRLHQTAVHEVVRASRQSVGHRRRCRQVSVAVCHLLASQRQQQQRWDRSTRTMMRTSQTWSSQRMRLLPDHAIHCCCCPPPHVNSIHGSLIYQRTSHVLSTSRVLADCHV